MDIDEVVCSGFSGNKSLAVSPNAARTDSVEQPAKQFSRTLPSFPSETERLGFRSL
jgi:hypothetical protein